MAKKSKPLNEGFVPNKRGQQPSAFSKPKTTPTNGGKLPSSGSAVKPKKNK